MIALQSTQLTVTLQVEPDADVEPDAIDEAATVIQAAFKGYVVRRNREVRWVYFCYSAVFLL